MNQNKKNNSNIIKILVFLLLVSFIIYYLDNRKLNIDSYSAEMDYLENSILCKGIIIKDEEIYYSGYSGNIKYYYDEGVRIKKGSLLYTIYPDSDSVQIRDEIEKIENAISSKEIYEETSQNQENIKKTEKQLQDLLIEKKYQEAFIIIDNYEENINFKNEYTLFSLEELYQKKQSLESNLSSKDISVYSNKTGIISYKIDNAEDILRLDGLDNYNSSDYNILSIKENIMKKDYVDYNTPVIKVIDNFKWYLMIKIEDINIEKEDYIDIRLPNKSEILTGNIYKKDIKDNSTFIIIQLDRYFYEYFNDRYLDIELILKRYNGIKLKNSSIINKNGIKGVYVIGASKIVKFYPIKIIGEDKEYSIIDEGKSYTVNSRGQIKIQDKDYYTVKFYDKIISNPGEVEEGQILK